MNIRLSWNWYPPVSLLFSGVNPSIPWQINLSHLIKKNANHCSFIRNNVVPCICLSVMTYAWSDVTRNAGIRKTNRATRYVGPRVAGCALCYRVVPYCVIALWRIVLLRCDVLCYRVVTYYLYAQESFNLGEWVTLTTGPFYCRWKLSRGVPQP